jgi:ankyrin repeat protein
MMAAMFNQGAAIDLLLAHGANRDAREQGGLSALDLALRMNTPLAIERLQAV